MFYAYNLIAEFIKDTVASITHLCHFARGKSAHPFVKDKVHCRKLINSVSYDSCVWQFHIHFNMFSCRKINKHIFSCLSINYIVKTFLMWKPKPTPAITDHHIFIIPLYNDVDIVVHSSSTYVLNQQLFYLVLQRTLCKTFLT